VSEPRIRDLAGTYGPAVSAKAASAAFIAEARVINRRLPAALSAVSNATPSMAVCVARSRVMTRTLGSSASPYAAVKRRGTGADTAPNPIAPYDVAARIESISTLRASVFPPSVPGRAGCGRW
jgi:hypothetical protein